MIRVSPPELARELPGPQASISMTRAPRRTRCNAVQPPNAPAPTTAPRGRAVRFIRPARSKAPELLQTLLVHLHDGPPDEANPSRIAPLAHSFPRLSPLSLGPSAIPRERPEPRRGVACRPVRASRRAVS